MHSRNLSIAIRNGTEPRRAVKLMCGGVFAFGLRTARKPPMRPHQTMKPNLLVVQPADHALDPIIEKFCESCSETHWVYLVRPASVFRDDSPAGVRFLTNPLDKLPCFPVDIAIAVGDEGIAAKVKEKYPDSETLFWNPVSSRTSPPPMLSKCRKVLSGAFQKLIGSAFPRPI